MATLYESITEKIIQLIEEQRTLPWQKPWGVAFPQSAVSGRPYRGINALILSATNFADPRWLTFRQCQALGGRVLKGARATQITLWKFSHESKEDENQKKLAPLVRSFGVFNIDQCEGLDLPSLPTREMTPETLASAERMISGYLDGPRIIHGGAQACYVPAKDVVEMPNPNSFVSTERYFDVLAHELCHSSGAAHRLARKGVIEPIHFHSEGYASEELVAQIGASFLCGEFGVDNTIESSAAYIDGWLDALRRDKTMIVRAAGQAQRASDWVLNRR